MSEDPDLRYLVCIREAIGLVEARTRAGREVFFQDVDVQDAVLWRLQTLAEASGKLSNEIKSRHPEMRWRAVYGFRNVAAHGYLDLRLEEVWEILTNHLPALRIVIEGELNRRISSWPHRDPFDRVLVAQSQRHQLPLLTADPLISQYDVPVIW